jgi:hypothetical protein
MYQTIGCGELHVAFLKTLLQIEKVWWSVAKNLLFQELLQGGVEKVLHSWQIS